MKRRHLSIDERQIGSSVSLYTLAIQTWIPSIEASYRPREGLQLLRKLADGFPQSRCRMPSGVAHVDLGAATGSSDFGPAFGVSRFAGLLPRPESVVGAVGYFLH